MMMMMTTTKTTGGASTREGAPVCFAAELQAPPRRALYRGAREAWWDTAREIFYLPMQRCRWWQCRWWGDRSLSRLPDHRVHYHHG